MLLLATSLWCVAGHNCFGAVLYPITMADFVCDSSAWRVRGVARDSLMVLQSGRRHGFNAGWRHKRLPKHLFFESGEDERQNVQGTLLVQGLGAKPIHLCDFCQSCFSSFMSMHCSSIFPRCTTPFSRDVANFVEFCATIWRDVGKFFAF